MKSKLFLKFAVAVLAVMTLFTSCEKESLDVATPEAETSEFIVADLNNAIPDYSPQELESAHQLVVNKQQEGMSLEQISKANASSPAVQLMVDMVRLVGVDQIDFAEETFTQESGVVEERGIKRKFAWRIKYCTCGGGAPALWYKVKRVNNCSQNSSNYEWVRVQYVDCWS